MVQRLILLVAVLLCSVSFALEDRNHANLEEARRLVAAKDLRRIDALVEVMAFGCEADAREAYDLFRQCIEDREQETKALYKLYHTTPEGPEKDAISERIDQAYEPFRNQTELLGLGAAPLPFVRSLGQADPVQRRQMLRKLAREAGEDFKLDKDETYWGPRCGSYDHTNEYKILWAARFFRPDAIAALMDGPWDGRRWMILGLSDSSWGGLPVSDKLDPRVRPILLKLTKDASPLVRGQALLSFSYQNGSDVRQAVEHALSDPMADTRCKALWVAQCQRMSSLFPQVRTMIDDPVEIVRRHAITCLGAIGGAKAVDTLLPLLSKQGFDSHGEVLAALTTIKDPRIFPALKDLFERPGSRAREAILDSLVEIDPGNSDYLVLGALDDTNDDVVLSAISAAGKMKLRDAAGAITRLVNHKNEDVRDVARRVLDELNYKGGGPDGL